MWCVQVRQVATGRLLGQPERLATLCGALAYRLWLEGQGVPRGYELACWLESGCSACVYPRGGGQ
jgi:hypothetical protein